MVEDLESTSMHSLLEVSNGTSHVPAFLAKLWKIVDDPNTDDLICWSEMGNSFLVRNQSKFARELLPLYYKHNNMASFVRQLNMYGFHKEVSVEQGGLRNDKDEMEFAHPFFLRGSESTLELIKRKIPAAKLEDPRGSRPDTINKQVLLDVRQMKGRQDTMDNKLMNVKRENEALWRELSVLRQKHAKQQQIVSKLLQFLVGMMSSQSHRIGFKRRMHMNVPLMLNDADGLKGTKRTKNSGAELIGPVIRDVTDYVNSSDRMLEDESEYGNFHSSDIESSHPKIDSPSSTERSPYPESIYPMSPYDDPDMLLSVDPSTINPSVEMQPSEIMSSSDNRGRKQGGKPKGKKFGNNINKSTPSTSTVVSTTANTTDTTVATLQDLNLSSDGKIQGLPTIMYIPGMDNPVQVVLSIPEQDSSTASLDPLNNAETPSSDDKITTTAASSSQGQAVLVTTAPSESVPSSSSAMQLRVPSAQKTPPVHVDNLDSGSSTQMVLAADGTLRHDLDGHLDEMQMGLDNLRELLKQDHYSIDSNTLLSLFGNEADILAMEDTGDLQDKDDLDSVPTAGGESGMDMVAYNPSLYELTDDDTHYFDYQNNGDFLGEQRSLAPSTLLDDELESMLTADRDKLRAGGELKGDSFSASSST